MRPHRASFTAAFVAVCRGLSPLLPESARLVTDPHGARLAGPAGEALVNALASGPEALRALSWGALWPMLPWVIYMQVRTRALDDALLRFVEAGGRQVVILGAGFDARALRLRERLGEAVVFEVDHPATQARKRELFGEPGNVRALAWDFEQDPMSELPGRLAALGHDRTRPTFTLWEGVTMYLTREAIGATLAAVRDHSAPGSQLAFNYVERKLLEGSSPAAALVTGFVAAVGEPFRSGFSEQELAALLREHGFAVQEDRSFEELSRRLLGAPWTWAVREGKRLALVERTATAIAT
jgi:methyltransferase (TIGR00027 family)